MLVSLQTAVKCGHGFEISGWIICAVGTGARYKTTPIVVEVCTGDQICFGCFYVFDIANTEI